MAAPLGTARARLRAQLTGETYQQAREFVVGPDGIPAASHREQLELEAAVFAELDDLYAGEGHPLDGGVYGINRVQPTRQGIVLTLLPGAWECVLAWLLPEPDEDLEEGLFVSGVPGLRARAVPPHRVELYRPGTTASIVLALPPGEAPEAHQWLADWAEAVHASLPAYKRWSEDAAARSAVLRRLLAFRSFPGARLIDEDGAVPSRRDFQQILAAQRQAFRPAPAPSRPATPSPRFRVVAAQRPVVLAVVSGHTRTGAALGGQGRSTVAARLAGALAEHGRRVLLADTDPGDPLMRVASRMHLPDGVTAARFPAGHADLGAAVRAQAATDDQDIVLLDASPDWQQAVAEAADGWLGVAALGPHPGLDHPLLATETLGAGGRPLPDGWEWPWLRTMRSERWAVTWRLVPRDGDALFAPFAADRCAGVLLLGTRETPGARACDFLSAYRAPLPVLQSAIPYDGGDPRSRRRVSSAYRALAAELLGMAAAAT
jgi:hypothetical protein